MRPWLFKERLFVTAWKKQQECVLGTFARANAQVFSSVLEISVKRSVMQTRATATGYQFENVLISNSNTIFWWGLLLGYATVKQINEIIQKLIFYTSLRYCDEFDVTFLLRNLAAAITFPKKQSKRGSSDQRFFYGAKGKLFLQYKVSPTFHFCISRFFALWIQS